MPDAASPWGSFGDICRAVLRHKAKAIVYCSVITSAVAIATFLWPKTYRSEGKLLVRLGRENATLDPSATLGHESVVAVPISRDSEINSVVEILQSRSLLEKVVDTVGVNRFVDGVSAVDRERALRLLASNLRVAAAHKSNVVEAVFEGRSPELCQGIVGTLLTVYVGEHARLNRPQGSQGFFVEQAERLQRDLIAKENALRDLKASTGLLSPDNQRQALVGRLDHLQDELIEVDTATAASEAKMQTIRQRLSGMSETRVVSQTTGVANEGSDRMRDSLYALQVAAEEAATRYTEDHPKMQQIRQQIAEAEKIFQRQDPSRTQTTTAGNRSFEELDAALLEEEPRLASLQARAAALRRQTADLRGQLKAFGEDALRIAQLQRDVDLCQTNYCKYSSNVEGARIDETMERERMSNLSVVQPASYEPREIRPQKALSLAMGLLLGVLGGVGAAVVAEGRNRTLRTPEDIESKLHLAALGTIPQIRRRHLIWPGERST